MTMETNMGIVYYQHFQTKSASALLENDQLVEGARTDNERIDPDQVDFAMSSVPYVYNYTDADYFADRIFLSTEMTSPMFVASAGFEHSWLETIAHAKRVPRYNIHFVFEGSGSFNSVPVSKGQAFISMPNEKYTIINNREDPMKHGWISLAGSDIENMIKALKLPTASVIGVKDIDEVQNILKDAVYGAHHKAQSLEILEHLLLSKFFKTLSLLDYSASFSATKVSPRNKYIGIVNDYINNHYHYNITVTDLARHADISVSYLRHIFSVNLGISPQTAIINKKMDIAKQILVNTSVSIAVIATECGYADQSAFCKVFKKTQGIPPLRYRKIHSNLKNQ